MYEQATAPHANPNHESAVWAASPKQHFWIKCKTALEPVRSERDIGVIHVEAVLVSSFCKQQSLKLSDRKELNASHVWYAFLVQAKLHV